MEEVVREARTSPAEQDIVVQGKLVIGTGAWWPRPASHRETPCDEDMLSLSLEATVEGACYAIGVSRTLMCDVDASRLCCDHLPLNQEVAFAGRLSHKPGLDFFFAYIDGVICRLPPDATSTSRPSAGGTPP